MGMNPKTNKFEPLQPINEDQLAKQLEGLKLQNEANKFAKLIRPDGSLVPKHWSVFKIGDDYVIENYTFRCVYIGESNILFEPVSPVIKSPEGGES